MKPNEDCQRCGGSNITWHAPSPLWNGVMRHPDGREASERWSIVCPQCFVEIAEQNGVVKDAAWHLDVPHGGLTVELATVSTDGRVWDPLSCLWYRPPTVDRCPVPGCIRLKGHPNFHCTSEAIAKREDR